MIITQGMADRMRWEREHPIHHFVQKVGRNIRSICSAAHSFYDSIPCRLNGCEVRRHDCSDGFGDCDFQLIHITSDGSLAKACASAMRSRTRRCFRCESRVGVDSYSPLPTVVRFWLSHPCAGCLKPLFFTSEHLHQYCVKKFSEDLINSVRR